MRVRLTVVASAALGASLLTGSVGAASVPYLRSAAPSRGHVVAVFTLGQAEIGDVAPDHIAVATSAATQRDGSFVTANVRVLETMANPAQTTGGGMRVRTVHKLRPGRYWVKVSGKVVGLDCTPKLPCKELWSNARRVVIPR
jgi:hypothetical protein